MTLSQDQVLELVKDGNAEDWIQEARNKATLYRMHYYGEGLAKHLTQITGLENDDQIKLRKRYAISNEALLSSLFQPTNNAWSAKGGVVHVDITESQQQDLKDKIGSESKKNPIKTYLMSEWFDRFVTDPNGLLYMEVSKDGSKTYPVYKSIFHINKMKVKGVKPEYIVFEPHEEVEETNSLGKKEVKTVSWVVDDAFYYELTTRNGTPEITKQIPNSYKEVPSVQNSPIKSTLTGLKVSVLHKQLDLLDSYLIDNSVNNIYKKLHGFPAFVYYTGKCESCKGTGEIEGETCSSCNGSGQSMKRDVSDGIPMMTPSDNEAPIIKPSDAVAYIQPALETWQEQRTELKHLTDVIYFSHWGTSIEKTENETATGRFIDAQQVVNRLHQYSDIFQMYHKYLLDWYVEFYITQDVESTVSYGRRYLVETPDQIWKKYLEAKENGADESTKDLLLSQFYESEFQSDESLKNYYLKLIDIEPLVHYSIPDVLEMSVSDKIKQTKVAFPRWKDTQPMSKIIDTELNILIKNLNKYTNEQLQSIPEDYPQKEDRR